jgi:murein DD-endopeptidase MepM/ murein hydrolase activator NlpD
MVLGGFMRAVLASLALVGMPAVWVPARFQPPVVAPIFDHFRPPACVWCAGNRGIDYAVEIGTAVHPAAFGEVEFAGPVGLSLFVVIRHPDGLRTTYGFLSSVLVTTGQQVGVGDVVGLSTTDLHFGVRRGGVYLDPEPLLVARRLRARLVA